jgi:hypothetical protein
LIRLVGNLDCEAAWAGAPPPPAHVARRIAALATTMRALVDGDDVMLWTAVGVTPSRIPAVPGLPPVRLAVGVPPAGVPALAWGATAERRPAPPIERITAAIDPGLRAALAATPPDVAIARAVNDRRFAFRLRETYDGVLAGSAVVDAIERFDAAARDAAAATGGWIAKAAIAAAGRDRARGGVPVRDDVRVRVARLIERHGAVVVEPALDVRAEYGVTGAIDAAGAVAILEPHALHVRGGGFDGITPRPERIDPGHHAAAIAIATAVGGELCIAGYRGPYTVDSIVHAGGFHPLSEINARLTFGVVARALCARLGRTRFRVGDALPSGDIVPLVAPIGDDPSAAWLA